jgi:hypothetical protein
MKIQLKITDDNGNVHTHDILSLPTDQEIQAWGEEYADEHHEKSDNPLSPWWKEAETFTNGGRAVIKYIQKHQSLTSSE